MRKSWCAVAGLVLLGLATPAFAQFGGPPGFGGKGSPLETQLKKIEAELQKTQEQVAALKEEVAKLKGAGSAGKGPDFSKFKGQFDEKKMAEMKKAFEDKKGDMKKFFEGKGFGKGPKGFGPPGHMKHHGQQGDQKSGGSSSKAAATTDHEILLQILQELKALRKQN